MRYQAKPGGTGLSETEHAGHQTAPNHCEHFIAQRDSKGG